MEQQQRHVSRWRLATHGGGTNSKRKEDVGGASAEGAAFAQAAHTSLRYLNEFVGGLQCAPALLQHGLFPDAKEVTESMGLFNAVRRYLLPDKDAAVRVDANQTSASSDSSEKPDGIVVVGDGNTPRSAAMFAYRLRHWKCFSIDPAMEMQSSERSRGWSSIGNLVVIRNKIENVRISLRRAIVVLVHAHVTLEQALGAVDADEVAGVVTMPCCNWYSHQEQLFGRQPDLVYDDFSILSDHREIRLWVGESQSKALEAQHSDFASSIESVTGLMKGCIHKEFCPGAIAETEADVPLTRGGDGSVRSSKRQADTNVVAFLGSMLSETKSTDTRGRNVPQGKQGVNVAALDAVVTCVPTDASVLVLDSQTNLSWIRAMLKRGYANVYTLKKRSKGIVDDGEPCRDTATLSLELHRFRPANSTSESETCGTIEIKSLLPSGTDSDQSKESINVSVTFSLVQESSASSEVLVRLTHIIDAGFLYRGFRFQPKNAALFRNVCHLLEHIARECFSRHEEPEKQQGPTALVSVTGAKTWRKKEYFGHSEFGYDISTTMLDAATPNSKPVVVFHCRKRSVEPAKSSSPNVLDLNETVTRDRVLGMKRALASDFATIKRSLEANSDLGAGSITTKDAIMRLADVVSEASAMTTRRHFVVTGKIARIRRFSHGMAFVSLVNDGNENQGKRAHDVGLQVFIQEETLKESSPSVPFAELVPLFRRGDQITVVGFARTSDRGREMLAALVVKFEAGGEFEEF